MKITLSSVLTATQIRERDGLRKQLSSISAYRKRLLEQRKTVMGEAGADCKKRLSEISARLRGCTEQRRVVTSRLEKLRCKR